MAKQKEPDEQEMQAFQQVMEEQVRKWKERLKDPVFRQQVEAGILTVNPLLRHMLSAFLPQSNK